MGQYITPREAHNRALRYGIAGTEYLKLIEDQAGACAICGHVPDDARSLFVDHDHDTGRVRGLLCHHCNIGLGMFRDDTQRLRTAIRYLDVAQSTPKTPRAAATRAVSPVGTAPTSTPKGQCMSLTCTDASVDGSPMCTVCLRYFTRTGRAPSVRKIRDRQRKRASLA